MQCSAAASPRTRSTCWSACRVPARRSSRSSTSLPTRRPSGPPSTSPRCRSRSTRSSATARRSASSIRKRSALGLLRRSRRAPQRAWPGRGRREDQRPLQAAPPGIVVVDSFKALSAYAERGRLSPIPPQPRRPPLGVPGLVVLDRRVLRGRDRLGSGVRRRRRHHRPLDDAGGRARDALAPRPEVEGKPVPPRQARLPDRGATGSPRSRGSQIAGRNGLRARRGATLVRDSRARSDARRRLLAGRLDALRRPFRVRQDR